MTTATVEATNHPITPTLLDVRVGDLVILETRRGMSYSRYIHPRLVSISQVDKRGRLFVCNVPSDYAKNYRYGFDPTTGISPKYPQSKIRYATIEEIDKIRFAEVMVAAAENARIAELQAAARLANAAPQLAAALLQLVQLVSRLESNAETVQALDAASSALSLAGVM
jgi:hypothetical protein